MGKLVTQILLCGFFIFLVLNFCPVSSDEVEDETEFNYEHGSERGPERWGEIRPEWSMCSNGTLQSPIDLLDQRVEVVSHLGRIKKNYKPSNATLKNRGHDMMIRTVTREQINLLRVAVHDDSDTNARPIQKTNWRSVELIRDEEIDEED
ncbi:hypothetical protein TIFTF001_000731 [Ficus carica]|uniref:Alpha-carbonic anhydrase domain-containing protein n=1 Tax=Ficus carica TaxID=3494 RepID=A0AA87ZHX4_FICCA|nr:hypothetical protein TIFTF001_000731 [Ficus carica]